MKYHELLKQEKAAADIRKDLDIKMYLALLKIIELLEGKPQPTEDTK